MDKNIKLIGLIYILFFINSKINLILYDNKNIIKTFTEFTTYSIILLYLSIIYPNNNFIINLAICCNFATFIGYWCVIYQQKDSIKPKYIFAACMNHIINIVIILYCINNYYNINKINYYSFIVFILILLLILVCQQKTRKYLTKNVYGKSVGDLYCKKTYMNLIQIIIFTFIFYYKMHKII
jgi:hypothetical protein